ncbi:hypothetical protein JZ751_006980 [Albula glossodonta]|uniref:Uncharacterized protein n=1 Tax=Albula glossodonta TaxID=121402 RepID=A0A8T2PAX6_9TELE|nr:hypothetical protein JZ751_006980 [Albula glossodonta]
MKWWLENETILEEGLAPSSVDTQVGVDIRLVREWALDTGCTNNSIQPHDLVLISESLVVDADDMLVVWLGDPGTDFSRRDFPIQDSPGDTLPGVVHLETCVQMHQPLSREHTMV